MTTPKLLTIDGLNIVRRVFEANLAPVSEQKVEGALRSSLSSFKRAIATHEPTHAAAIFDSGGLTWRHALYPQYRAGRKPMPEILRAALPSYYETVRQTLGVTCYVAEGVEADDVLAQVNMAWMLEFSGYPATLLSTDKDLAQLAALGVLVWNHFKEEPLDNVWCQKKYGVPLELLGDLLSLMGDAVDGIPGVTSVGPTTAAKLLLKYGSLDTLLSNSEEVPGKLGTKLREEAELARLSRQLVGFKTDTALPFTLDDLALA